MKKGAARAAVVYQTLCVLMVLVVSMVFGALEIKASDALTARVHWVGSDRITANQGLFNLTWEMRKGFDTGLYRVEEEFERQARVSYVDQKRMGLYRVQPGVHTFQVSVCEKRSDGAAPVCGKPSKVLSVEVAEPSATDIASETLLESQTGVIEADAVAAGPDSLKPGLWFNSNRNGHGWSFYWANRLALPEADDSHGPQYDLVGYWYTYQAHSRFLDCEASCEWRYEDYRPVAVVLRMIQVGSNRYSGGLWFFRGGQEIQQGSVTIDFSDATHTEARLDWQADFALQRMSQVEEIQHLGGSQDQDAYGLRHYSGSWQNDDWQGVTVISDISRFSEATEVVFLDAQGDLVWVQAVNQAKASEALTSFCFYYIAAGYAPTESGAPGLVQADGCDPTQPASITNRNAWRRFLSVDRQEFWIGLNLPGGLGAGGLHSNSIRSLARKTNFHRLEVKGSTSCVIEDISDGCSFTISGFSDSDHPELSLFSRPIGSGGPVLHHRGLEPYFSDLTPAIFQTGQYQFELKASADPNSSTVAVSAPVLVSHGALDAPVGLEITWQDEPRSIAEIHWQHSMPSTIDYWELKLSWGDPVQHQKTQFTQPRSSIVVDWSDGPFGALSVKLRACRQKESGNDCSAWSSSVAWSVPEPTDHSPDVEFPWQSAFEQSGTLQTGLGYNYAMGYHFKVKESGQVVSLGGLFEGSKVVRLFERVSGKLLTQATVIGDTQWQYAPVVPVSLHSGREYTVAVYLAGSGGSKIYNVDFPADTGNVSILSTTWISTASQSDARPVNSRLGVMYGQADIGFIAGQVAENLPPAFDSLPEDIQSTEGNWIEVPITAVDPEGGELSFSASGLPEGLVINAQTGSVSGVPALGTAKTEAYEVSVSATDDIGQQVTVDLQWHVQAVILDPAAPDEPPMPAAMPVFEPDADSIAAGVTSGQFEVDDGGAANYQIPLLVGPGSGGLVPDLALAFNSQSGAGLAGRSWDLSGFSTISRCPATPEHDGLEQLKRVNWSIEDRFCLDGQRMILSAGRWGQDGSEYRMAGNPEIKVFALGSAGQGPARFRVLHGDGSTSVYGATPDTRIEVNDPANDQTAAIWHRNEYRDPFGNYIEFRYQEVSTPAVESYPVAVHYTGNVNAGIEPYSSVSFEYEPVALASSPQFIAGVAFARSVRLKTIKSIGRVDANSAEISLRAYHLEYGEDGMGRDVLESVTECRDQGQTDCYPSTRFEWFKSENGFNTENFSLQPVFTRKFRKLAAGDIDGDGRIDLLISDFRKEAFRFRIAFAQSDAGYVLDKRSYSIPGNLASGQPVSLAVLDLNADGRNDVAYPEAEGNSVRWLARLSEGSSLGAKQVVAANCCGLALPSIVRVMDFNGDGLADIVTQRAETTGASGSELVVLKNGYRAGEMASLEKVQSLTLEFDEELFPDGETQGGWWADDSLREVEFQTRRSALSARPVDFNGDGRIDFLARVSRNYIKCPEACGKGLATKPDPGAELFEFSLQGGEFEPLAHGNGEVSASEQNNALASFYILFEGTVDGRYLQRTVLAQGAGIDCSVPQLCGGEGYPGARRMFPVDINADGLADVVYQDEWYDWFFRLNTGLSFEQPVLVASPADAVLSNEGRFVDVNGDGFPDFALPEKVGKDSSRWVFHFNVQGLEFSGGEMSQVPSGSTVQQDASIFLDSNGDGAADLIFLDYSDSGLKPKTSKIYPGKNLLRSGSDLRVNVLQRIIDGRGGVTDVGYAPLSDPEVHTPTFQAPSVSWGRGAVVLPLSSGTHVVKTVSRDSPTWADKGAQHRLEYHYAGGRVQAGGRGFLGFAEIAVWDHSSGIRSNRRFHQRPPFTGLVADKADYLPAAGRTLAILSAANSVDIISSLTPGSLPPLTDSDVLLAYQVTRWGELSSTEMAGRYVRSLQTLDRKFTLTGAALKAVLDQFDYDELGRISNSFSEHFEAGNMDAIKEVATRTDWQKPFPNWHLGVKQGISVSHSRPGRVKQTRSTAYEHDSQTGVILRETTFPNDSALSVSTSYVIDDFGNRLKTTIAAVGVQPRIEHYDFEKLGRFVITQRNAYDQVTFRLHRWDVYGNGLEVSDVHGTKTRQFVDRMGRVFAQWDETGAWSSQRFRSGAGPDCPVTTRFRTFHDQGGKPSAFSCLDVTGREVRKAVQGFNGDWIFSDTGYDASGRAVRVSEPYFQGDQAFWNISTFDVLGRLTQLESAAGGDMSYEYDAAVSDVCGIGGAGSTRIENALGQVSAEWRNALGERVFSADAHCGVTSYDYDAMGNLTSVTGPQGATSRMSFDAAGRKISIQDPDKGFWQYRYNALGELTRQLDAQQQAIDFQYDLMGREVSQRQLSEVADLDDSTYVVSKLQTTHWNNEADASVSGKSLVSKQIYQRGSVGPTLHQLNYEYDRFGRLIAKISHQGGSIYQQEITYDEFGRVFQEFDASGDFRGVRYLYNTTGYVHKLRESREGIRGKVYRETVSMDAAGQISYALMGNGLEVFQTTDPSSGRIVSQEAYDISGRNIQEIRYAYDVLGNLLSRTGNSNHRDIEDAYQYDALNRLISVHSSSQGSELQLQELQYDALGNITWKSDVGHYRYGEGAAGPHAVSTAGNTAYQYDSNGNQVSGDGRSIQYDGMDKAVNIIRDSHEVQFDYGIQHKRIERRDFENGDLKRLTRYIGSVEFVEESGSARFRRNIAGMVYSTLHQGGNSSFDYVLRDSLGSVHSLSDDSGLSENVIWLSFDAFGKRVRVEDRSALNWADSQALAQWTTRGYTGHEHVDPVGLIHMNGRMYDPDLGRFIQADPYVSAAADGQALNRYSYALNNPLYFTDPSGYFLSRFLKRWGRLAVAVALSVLLPGSGGILATHFGVGNVYVQAAITGFVAGAITSGTLKGAAIGAIVAVAVTGIVKAHSNSIPGKPLAQAERLAPTEADMELLFGPNGPSEGLFRVQVGNKGAFGKAHALTANEIKSGDTIFTNGMKNGFQDAVRNGTIHLNQAGLLSDGYVLNFNATQGFLPDLLEASVDVLGAHVGSAHSSLAREFAHTLHGLSEAGVSGIRLVGHSQGGAITASALRYAARSGLNLSALSGGGVSFHGAPVNAWLANRRFGTSGWPVLSRAQFGDAVHVLGGLNVSNPLELPVALLRMPSLFSSDSSFSPHSLPCSGGASALCSY